MLEPLRFLVWLACALVLLGMFPGRSLPVTAVLRHTMPPNIVLILTDDQDLRLGTMDVMPLLETHLSAKGTTFSNAFVPLSLCCPSRASLLTGRYAHSHGIYTNLPPTGGFQRILETGLEETTIAATLQSAGYRTGLIGKYVNGYPLAGDSTYVPPGWDEWFVPITNSAYGSYGYTVNDDGDLVNYGNSADDYITDVLARESMGFITRTVAMAPAAPFFLQVSIYAPHTPANPAPRHHDLFPNAMVPRTPSYNEADMRDKPSFMQALPSLTITDTLAYDSIHRNRLRSLQAVDELVAGVIQTLETTGQLDNTYVVFTSDNGFHMGHHRLPAGKGTPYEEDVWVPLVVRGPGVLAGAVRSELVSLVDLAPTFAEIAETVMAHQPDGRSLLTLFRGAPSPAWRTAILVEHYPNPGQHTITRDPALPSTSSDAAYPDFLVLRTDRYKLITRGRSYRELYDLAMDPFEVNNRFRNAEAEFLAEVEGWLTTYSACSGLDCHQIDAVPPPDLLLTYRQFVPMTSSN